MREKRIFEIEPDMVPPVYQPYLLDDCRYLVLYGGRGSGKTAFACRKMVLRCFLNQYFKCVYVRKAAAHIRDSLYAGLKAAIDDLGLTHYFKFYDSDYRIICINGNSFIPKGVDDPELTKGVEEVSHLLIEEITELTQDEFTTLNALLRTEKTKVQTVVMFNPILATHWLRNYFFHPDDRHAPNPSFGDRLKILRTTYRDNNFINRAEYYRTLLDNACGNKNRIRVDVDGDWGMMENGNPWAYAFDYDKHVVPQLPFLAAPVYLSFDFNKHPVTCTATQMSPSRGTPDSFLHVLKEFSGDISLQQLCKRIKQYFPQSIFYVTGDASGASGHLALEEVGKNETFYTLIKKYLKLSDKQINTFGRNLAFNDSRILVNTMLYHYPNFKISEAGCPILIQDMQIATVDDKGQDANKLKKDRDLYKMDMFDNFRYMLQAYYFEYCNKLFPDLQK